MQDPGFTPAAIKKASVACEAICMWAQAMYKYHFVALGVAPKKAKLAEAEAELKVVMAQLADAKVRARSRTHSDTEMLPSITATTAYTGSGPEYRVTSTTNRAQNLKLSRQ